MMTYNTFVNDSFIINIFINTKEIVYAPGGKFLISNTNYCVCPVS